MNLTKLRNEYMQEDYGIVDANAKVCQDIILSKIGKSSLSNNITIKGGVVMHHMSKDVRRATRDLDLDFIKYSLEDEAIEKFITKLNDVKDGVKIKITSKIEPLSHQDYDGKRVHVELNDEEGNKVVTKLDIGVHKDFDISQDEYCFDLNLINQTATLLVNSKEQIFTEKLKSLLKLGQRSTRYKDFFDIYYLIKNTTLNKDKLKYCVNKFIFYDAEMFENNSVDIYRRLNIIFENKEYLKALDNIKNNWLGINPIEGKEIILEFIKTI